MSDQQRNAYVFHYLAKFSATWLVWVVFLLMFSWCPSVWSQAASGGLRGRVLDSDFGVPVKGAVVSIVETGQKATTDEQGDYFFESLAPGSYTITLIGDGFIAQSESGVVVTEGQLAERSFRLTAEVVELEAFVVRAEELEEASGLEAIDIRLSMDSFSDVLGSEFFSRSGASDVGGALTKVAGTTVVDSRYVVVRGLGDRYNVVVLNGLRIPSSDPDKRAVNVDIFPTDLVETLVTSKTYTPDMPGEATGGYINIITKSVPKKPFVSSSLGIGYNTRSTGNKNFLGYRGGGTGFLGSADSRPAPEFLFGQTATTLGTQTNPSAETIRLRNLASDFFAGTTMGVNLRQAPMDFSFDASLGTTLDYFGSPLGLLAAMTYSKNYRLRSGARGKAIRSGTRDNSITSKLEYNAAEEELLAGLLLVAGYEVNPDNKITTTIFSNIAASDEAIFQIGTDRALDITDIDVSPDESPELLIQEALSYTERRLATLQLTGEHLMSPLGDSKITWGAAYSMSSQNQPDQRFSSYAWKRDTQQFRALSGADRKGAPFERLWRRLDDTNYNLAAKIDVPLFEDSAGEKQAVASFGGSFDHSTRNFEARNFAYSVGSFGTWPTQQNPTASNLDGFTTADIITSEDQANPDRDTTYIRVPALPLPFEFYDASQNILGAFAQVRFDLASNLEVLAGARIETTDINMTTQAATAKTIAEAIGQGSLAFELATGELFTLQQLARPRLSQTDFLPAISVSWDFFKDMKLRFAASKTIARPTFKELAPVNTRDPGSSDFVSGNPNIKMSDITNVDFRWEWFPNPGDLFAVSAFTKDIRRPIELFTSGPFQQFGNEISAILYGFEIEARKGLGSLASELEPFSLGFNYAYIFSQTQLTEFSKRNRASAGLSLDRSLQGQPDYTMNFDITYDNKDYGLTASLFLNVTGQLLYLVGANDGQNVSDDIIQKPFTSLDFTLSKKLSDTFKISFKASNLINSLMERVYETDSKVFRVTQSGTTYSVSVSGEW